MPDMSHPTRFDLLAGPVGLSLGVAPDGRLHQLGFGAVEALPPAELPFPILMYPLALPTHGEEALREPALRITHGDGVLGTRLVFRSTEEHAAPSGGGVIRTIDLVDRVAPTVVRLGYRTWPANGVIESWVEVVNEGDAPLVVHEASAVTLAFGGTDPHVTHWGGGWAAEWQETTEPIRPGVKTVRSWGGSRPSLTLPPVVLVAPDGRATETEGTVIACTLVWGGDTRFDLEHALHRQLRLLAGHQHRAAERHLAPGESFETPHALLTWSGAGIGPTSRAFHDLARTELVRDGERTRATVVNTWEAVGFSLDTDRLIAQVDRAADLGAELFLLDDGWFGSEFPREDDTVGLGDWDVDVRKFPDGLQPTIDRTLERGLRFGLWVEPEMVNPVSVLYREHPDWVVAEPDRERREFRQQLILDLCRPEVRAFVVDTIDRVLTEHPGISYLKWDANRDLFETWTAALPADRQSHAPVDLARATWSVMEEVARRHPDVELMLCASGGGRSDLGTLAWFHEVWTSDDTDPVDRIRIQWGASHLLPASVIAAHVTRWGAKPVDFGCAVAMAGRFGFDLDLTGLSDDEWRACQQATASTHALRDLVQHGDLHRLVSPLGNDRAAVAYLAPAAGAGTVDRAVVFAWVFPEGQVAGERHEAPPTDGVTLPEALRGGDWEVVDHTPGRAEGAPTPTLDGDVLPWPQGSYGATVVELRRR